MKKFIALYRMDMAEMQKMMASTSAEERKKSMGQWEAWMKKNMASFADHGGPVGKTKRVAANGATDIKNDIGGYSIVIIPGGVTGEYKTPAHVFAIRHEPGRVWTVVPPSASGEIGRRARFRFWCPRTWGFKSPLAHRFTSDLPHLRAVCSSALEHTEVTWEMRTHLHELLADLPGSTIPAPDGPRTVHARGRR